MNKKFFLIISFFILLIILSIFVASQGSVFRTKSDPGRTSTQDSIGTSQGTATSGSTAQTACERLTESSDTTLNGLPANTGDGGFIVSAVKPECGKHGAIDFVWTPSFFEGFDNVKAQCFSLADTMKQEFDSPLSEASFSTTAGRGNLGNCQANGAVILIPDVE